MYSCGAENSSLHGSGREGIMAVLVSDFTLYRSEMRTMNSIVKEKKKKKRRIASIVIISQQLCMKCGALGAERFRSLKEELAYGKKK